MHHTEAAKAAEPVPLLCYAGDDVRRRAALLNAAVARLDLRPVHALADHRARLDGRGLGQPVHRARGALRRLAPLARARGLGPVHGGRQRAAYVALRYGAASDLGGVSFFGALAPPVALVGLGSAGIASTVFGAARSNVPPRYRGRAFGLLGAAWTWTTVWFAEMTISSSTPAPTSG